MADPDNSPLPRRVVFRGRYAQLPRQPLQQFAQALSHDLLGGRDFACLITNHEEMAQLNGAFRKKPESTDVLSFPAQASPAPQEAGNQPQYAGDIAISIGHARQQARTLGHSLQDEVRVLMLHGALHLAGMDHETDDGAMRRAEERWRKHYGLPRTLIARAQ
jgi:probable rRNA maturation factor